VKGRRDARVRVSWREATAAFLLVSDYKVVTHRAYEGHLKRAGELLGKLPLAQLTAEQLEAYRASVLESRRGTKSQALAVVRVFLSWAAEHGLHELSPEMVREVLRPPGAARGIAPLGRRARWRRELGAASPPAAAPSLPATLPAAALAAFGYPWGIAGLALAAEEIHALREALLAADPKRWGELVSATGHPVAGRPGGAAAAALNALRAAGETRRDGPETFLAGLGYGAGGEGRLLGALWELRMAFAVQQRSTLGSTVWQLHWTEVPIPILAGRDNQQS
jgi:hypothetical protein